MTAQLITQTGPQRGLVLKLENKESWTIGRDPEVADFVLEDSTVSRKHLRLTQSPEGILLESLSRTNPTLINEEKVVGKVLLREGDQIQIGHSVFLFSEKIASPYDDIFGDVGQLPESFEEPPPPSKQPKREDSSAYDTIFEDTGEPLSLHFFSETPLMVKVIAGPNAGAEIGIEKGRTYLIGKDPNSCDIVFQDLSVSRNHARLLVSEEGTIEIEDLGSKNGTAVNGIPITDKKLITTQDLIALGTTVFLMIDREAPQETIYSPLPSSFEAPKETPLVDEEAPVAAKEIPEDAKKDWKREPIPSKYLIAAGCFVLSFFIVFLSFFSLFKSKKLEMAPKEPKFTIKEALAPYEGVQFTYNPGSGKLFLAGHILNSIQAQELQYRLTELPFITSVENNVVIDELVWKTMNEVLFENTPWKTVSIHSPQPGKFVINGFVATNDEYVQLNDYLSSNFSYLDRLENQVAVAETITAQLQNLLFSQGFSAISFQTANAEVILSGRYSETMGKEYEDLLKKIRTIPGVAAVKNFAVPTTPNQAAIDLSNQFQVAGSANFEGEGYNVVLNGRIYALGEEIQGMKITSIEKNMILLEKDGLKYKIDYTR